MKNISKFLLLTLAGLSVLALPGAAFSQGRGLGQDKKFERFVNGHDARDGRWDGRGPVFDRNSSFSFQQRRFRDRRFDNDDFRRDRWRDQRFEFRRRRFDNGEFNNWQRWRFRNRDFYRRGSWR